MHLDVRYALCLFSTLSHGVGTLQISIIIIIIITSGMRHQAGHWQSSWRTSPWEGGGRAACAPWCGSTVSDPHPLSSGTSVWSLAAGQAEVTHTVATQTELKQQCDMRHACVWWWEKEGWGQGWGVLVVLGDFWLLVIMSKSLIRCSWHISETKTNLCAWICPCVYVNTVIWRPTCSSYWDETLCEDSLENNNNNGYFYGAWSLARSRSQCAVQ